jgi:hypothetical protein
MGGSGASKDEGSNLTETGEPKSTEENNSSSNNNNNNNSGSTIQGEIKSVFRRSAGEIERRRKSSEGDKKIRRSSSTSKEKLKEFDYFNFPGKSITLIFILRYIECLE